MKWLVFLFTPFLFSAPIGNPSLPALLEEGFFISDHSWSNPQSGVGGDSLLLKRFRPCHSVHSAIRQMRVSGCSAMGNATWNIRERLGIQVDLGSGQFQWRWEEEGKNIAGQIDGGLIWSGDAKMVLLEMRDTSLGVALRAGGWDWMSGPASVNGSPLQKMAHSQLRYWQVGAALTQKISCFAPYLGAVVNRSRLKISRLSVGSGRFHARHQVGLFGGCSLTTGARFLLNLEWRGWFEQGVALSAQVRF